VNGVAATVAVAGASRRSWLQAFLRRPAAVASAAVLVVILLACIAAPVVAQLLGVDPQAMDLLARLAPPSAAHPLGTDELGRDLLVRLLHGGRISLLVGLGGALVTAVIGTAIGVLSGYVGGGLDRFLMRLTDAVIALPLLPLLIVLAAVDLAKLGVPAEFATGAAASVVRIVVIVALFGWTTVARLARAATLSLREREFVLAARALGASDTRIVLRHILPAVASPVVVATTLSIGNVILAESVLSFLGLGVQPPLATWGTMLTHAQELVFDAPRLALWPGLAIFVTVLAFNLLGDGLQDALDPRRREVRT
jgi:peptide/nickel transport system permease protein